MTTTPDTPIRHSSCCNVSLFGFEGHESDDVKDCTCRTEAVKAPTLLEIEMLSNEIKRLRTMSVVEMMCENANVKHHVEEWEKRCLKAERELTQAKDCLQRLVDLQNGCPLPKYREGWNDVMAKAKEMLG